MKAYVVYDHEGGHAAVIDPLLDYVIAGIFFHSLFDRTPTRD